MYSQRFSIFYIIIIASIIIIAGCCVYNALKYSDYFPYPVEEGRGQPELSLCSRL